MSRLAETNLISDQHTSTHAWSVNWWLIWKEARLLLPLLVSILLLGVILVGGQLWFGDEQSPSFHDGLELTLATLPGLLATGIGAVLVGQEREQGTVDWLASLPISRRTLVVTKMVIGTVGLLLIWMSAAIGIETLGVETTHSRWHLGESSLSRGLTPISYPLWGAHSFFIVLCGFYASWRIKNQFLAIIAIVFLAGLPIVMTELVSSRVSRWVEEPIYNIESSVWFVLSVSAAPVMGILAYRRAIKVLSPQTGSTFVAVIPSQMAVAKAPQFGSQVAPLIWQYLRSSRVLLIVLVGMLLAGTVIPLISVNGRFDNDFTWRVQTLLLALLAVPWLAVTVFRSDGAADRIRFLADRGVSPRKIYWARHAFPLAAVFGALVLYTLGATYTITQNPSDRSTFALPSMATAAFVLAILYSVSQWLSQLFRALTLAVLFAPLLSGAALFWVLYAIRELSTPFWFAAVVAVVPMLATWLLMPRYIDSRDRPLAFFVAAGVTSIVIGLPFLFTWSTKTTTTMSFSDRASLLAEAEADEIASPDMVTLEITDFTIDDDSTPEHRSVEQAMRLIRNRAESPVDFIPALKQLQNHPNHTATLELSEWGRLFDRLMLQRVIFEGAIDQEESADDQLADFISWLDATAVIADALRRSTKWRDQEIADRLEIWLVDTLNSPAMEPYRGAGFYRSIVSQLPSRSERNAARRSAVLVSWAKWARQTEGNKIWMIVGGIAIGTTLDHLDVLTVTQMADPHVESIVVTALDAAPVDDVNNTARPWPRRMHNLIIGPSVPFDSSSYSPRLRDLDAMMSIRLPSVSNEPNYLHPARFWGMAWEQAADELISASKHTEEQLVDE